jgi:hypothetical protein
MQNLDDERRQQILRQRAHLQAGIFRKKIGAAYFDASQAGMNPSACLREAITEGALTLLYNRSVELRGLSHHELVTTVWEQIRPNAAVLCGVRGRDGGRDALIRHVTAVVTRSLADAALEFWKRRAGADAVVSCAGAKSS